MLAGVLVAACAAASFASPALATDRNSVPPKIELSAGGIEGLVGPRSEALAYFSTGEGRRDGYTKDSRIRFTCRIDGRRARCQSDYLGRIALRHGRLHKMRGSFYGWVPVPKGLAGGAHTVTVIARDEDGVEPRPQSVDVLLDRTPPSAPELTSAPAPRSHDHKPLFGFSASDDHRLVREDGEMFSGALVRLKPTRFAYRSGGDFEGGFLSVWPLECPTLLACSDTARAAYMASERSYSYGEDEWLLAGLYELRLRARDAVGNKSPLTTYRFRILRGS
jgi:hypothetical protein